MKTKSKPLKLNYSGIFPECGCDEAGRGCLAGPVVAAAVILPPDFVCDDLNDSKQLSEIQREHLREIIVAQALAWSVGVADNAEVDQINILNASILSMHRAIDGLGMKPNFIIVDGNKFKQYKNTPHQTIVKGDGKYLSIAAASVLAKTYRDDLMKKLHNEYPVYDWYSNKAYPTVFHRAAIRENGVTPYHRLTFDLLGDKKLMQQKKRRKTRLKKSSTGLPELF